MIAFNNYILTTANGDWLKPYDPYNPLNLPPFTIRLKYEEGVTPTFPAGSTVVQVSQSPNIWDRTYYSTEWGSLVMFFDNDKVIEVLGANTTGVTKMNGLFSGCTRLITVPLFDTSSVTSMRNMFNGCTFLLEVPLFDTSSVTDMYNMFHGCSSLGAVPHFNTSNVTNMGYMFQSAGIYSVPLFNTSNVTNMGYMFWGSSIRSVPLFDTSSVTDMYSMFYGCNHLREVPLLNTSSLLYAHLMFMKCYRVESGALALYQQMSTQATPPSYHNGTFTDCGRDTVTGAAELAQIPTSWGGTME